MKQTRSANTLLIVIVILLVVILIGVAGGAYFYFEKEEVKKEDTPKENVTDIKTPDIKTLEQGKDEEMLDQVGELYDLDPFTVNLESLQGDVYLKVKIALELSIKELSKELDAKEAVIRDIVIQVLSSKTFEDVSTDEGKERTLDEIIDDINKRLVDGYIKNAYFTEFIIQ